MQAITNNTKKSNSMMFSYPKYSIIFIIRTLYLNLDIWLEIGKIYSDSRSKFKGVRLSFLISSEIFFLIFGSLLDIAIIQGNQSKQYFKDSENKSSMNTNNWDQQQTRLNKFVESKQHRYIFLFRSKSWVLLNYL